jgi:hypothetical protein
VLRPELDASGVDRGRLGPYLLEHGPAEPVPAAEQGGGVRIERERLVEVAGRGHVEALRPRGVGRAVEHERGRLVQGGDRRGLGGAAALPDQRGACDAHLLVGAEEGRAHAAEGIAQRHLAVGPLPRR